MSPLAVLLIAGLASLPTMATDTRLERNVLGTTLTACGSGTGFQRNGFCVAPVGDSGVHVVCAEVTADFLAFSAKQGNDLITPRPHFRFPGLHPGDHWCLCAGRWLEAMRKNVAPPVVLEVRVQLRQQWPV